MSITKDLSRWQNDEQGNMAIIFALLLMPLLAVIALSFDFAKASTAKIGLQSAADMAVHEAASAFVKNFKQRQNIANQAYLSFISSRKKVKVAIEVQEGKEVISDYHNFGLSQKDGYYIFTVDKMQNRTVSRIMGLGDIKLHVTARTKIPVMVSKPALNNSGGVIDREQLERQQQEALRRLRLLMGQLRDQGYFR